MTTLTSDELTERIERAYLFPDVPIAAPRDPNHTVPPFTPEAPPYEYHRLRFFNNGKTVAFVTSLEWGTYLANTPPGAKFGKIADMVAGNTPGFTPPAVKLIECKDFQIPASHGHSLVLPQLQYKLTDIGPNMIFGRVKYRDVFDKYWELYFRFHAYYDGYIFVPDYDD